MKTRSTCQSERNLVGSQEDLLLVLTRTVHLELVVNLTTEIFLLALRRFIACLGLCSEIWSDNARMVKRADVELKHLWSIINHPMVKDFYAFHKIQKHFLVEKAAWWGGFNERLIRSVKLAQRKTLGMSREELETLIIVKLKVSLTLVL
ncbi:hypothetical protein AVEN_93410-1 [Araneus ventricosus]|uniref:Integrase catalytic domain-containing protein n=1 Tax=Araneus ventricosus TaxID=182803 RepID=A0A4Y2ARJ5_ARAVE|nr:hypothetical protein AVEN_93410-1 [Araneus ventricosus]